MGQLNVHQAPRRWLGIPSCFNTDSLIDSNLTIFNFDSHTHLPSLRNPSSPHLIIASTYIAIESEWRILTPLNSDHPPILFQLGSFLKWTFRNLPIAPPPTSNKRTGTRSLVKRRYLSLAYSYLPHAALVSPDSAKSLTNPQNTTYPKVTSLTWHPTSLTSSSDSLLKAILYAPLPPLTQIYTNSTDKSVTTSQNPTDKNRPKKLTETIIPNAGYLST